jgi:hypothetical protein
VSFDYEKIKRKSESGPGPWASTSDLFMVLAVVFLLLYVVSGLRNGTYGLQKGLEYKELAKKAEDLEQQIKVYNTLKDNYLEKKAKKEEQVVYEELMNKLDLLQEERKVERNNLIQAAKDNEQKEKALNKYQQIIRNIINANVLAKSRLKKRKEQILENRATITHNKKTISNNLKLIQQKNQEILNLDQTILQQVKLVQQKEEELKQKQSEIVGLNKSIIKKKENLRKNKNNIAKLSKKLKKKIVALKRTKNKSKISQALYFKKLKALKGKTASKIRKLNSINKNISHKIQNQNQLLKEFKSKVAIEQKNKETLSQKLDLAKNEISNVKSSAQQEIENIKKQNSATLQQQQNDFEIALNSEKLTNQEKQKKIQAFNKELKKQKESMNQTISGLNRKIASTEDKLKVTKGENVKLNKDLKAAREKLEAKKKFANALKLKLKKAGIKSLVNKKSGDITLSFGKEYFNSGSSKLKGNMKNILNKFMPIYSREIFENKQISKKIKSVEIIGRASPTYKGKFVNPQSLSAKDQKAIKYNLDLSLKRAKSIFNHVSASKNLKYKHHKKIRRIIKVSGRGLFGDEEKFKNIKSGMSEKKFCKLYDCKKSQSVTIRFELE